MGASRLRVKPIFYVIWYPYPRSQERNMIEMTTELLQLWCIITPFSQIAKQWKKTLINHERKTFRTKLRFVSPSVHHRTIQINHQPDATIFQFIILTFIYSSTCFGRSPEHHQELNDCSSSLWFYLLGKNERTPETR